MEIIDLEAASGCLLICCRFWQEQLLLWSGHLEPVIKV